MAVPQIILPNPTVRSVILDSPLRSDVADQKLVVPVQIWLGGERDHVVLTWSGFRAAERYAMNLFAQLKSAEFVAKSQALTGEGIDLP